MSKYTKIFWNGNKVISSEELDPFEVQDKINKSFDYWQGVHEGKIKAAEKIIEYLTERTADLRECHKKDACLEMAIFTEGCIEDIQEQFLPQEPDTSL